MPIESDIQRLNAGEMIVLYQLDATIVGEGILYFTPTTDGNNGRVLFDGNEYNPIPIDADGFERSGKGAFARPKLRISNATSIVASVVINAQDLLGCTVTRIVTMKKYLDGQPDANPDATFPPEIYTIDRKSSHNQVFIEWELAPVIDQEGIMLPRRQVLRDVCTYIYRRWDATANDFVYDSTQNACPYAGSNYFDNKGNPVTDPALDKPSKFLSSCCKPRFGETAELPFRGFPGVGRF